MKVSPITIVGLLVFQLSACVEHNVSPTSSGTPAINNVGTNPIVYIGGTIDSAAVIWKNGIADTIDQGDISSLFVDGSDVYAAGWKWINFRKRKWQAAYWKNGVPVVLSDTSKEIYPQSIFVSNHDVYVVGVEWIKRPIARCWKNGIPVTLTNPDATSWSAATNVYVSGTNVYIAGLSNVLSKYPRATYWKNGEPVYLADGSSVESVAKSIFVSGNDVYVAGTVSWDDINDTLLNPEDFFLFGTETKCRATYWKNGMAVPLSTLGSYASSIFVNGTDVYVAGAIGSSGVLGQTPFGQLDVNIATYWKNGVQINLNDDNQFSLATSVSVTQNGDVYLAGAINRQAAFWVNGSKTYLSNDPSGNSTFLRAIFLTN